MVDLSVLLRRFMGMQAQLDSAPTFRWALVTQASPLRVQFDAAAAPEAGTPDTLVGALALGDRVMCMVQHRRVTVVGVGKGRDTGWINLTDSSDVTLGPGWTKAAGWSFWYRILDGNRVYVQMNGLVSPSMTVPSSGNIANSQAVILPPYLKPVTDGWVQPIASAGGGGRMISGFVQSGAIYVGAIVPNSDWGASTTWAPEQISIGGHYLL